MPDIYQGYVKEMRVATQQFLIQNENDFDNFLASMLSRRDLDSDKFDFPEIIFSGWPNVDINVKGDPKRYHSSLTASMLFGMADLTNEIQRAFTVISHDTHNRQKLKDSEKNLLDIVYKISEGSSQAVGDSDKIVNGVVSVLTSAMGRMTGRQALCAVLAIVLAVGTVSYKWVDEYYEAQRNDNHSKVDLVEKTASAINESQKNVLHLLTSGQTIISRKVLAHGEDGKNKFLKRIAQDPTVTTVRMGDQTVSRDQLNTISQRQSVQRIKRTAQDIFYISGVRRTGATNQDINIDVTRASNGESFTIKTTSDITSTEELLVFANAVAKESTIEISYVEVTENGYISAGQLINIIQ